ncbi:membrane protein [Mycobacterium phage LilSpotty]|uniref:Membrane protein n=1 Tax=Mycobacterium phage LilSpotty TaxID=2588512 RepID=A0A4Y6EV17_9CAUD|nr:membrane protein [Mycobacterium phage LilSpotty]QDF19769.1 membrane protein [Mycobacterium phage LilSpotty]
MTDRQLECHMGIYLAIVAAMCAALLVHTALM